MKIFSTPSRWQMKIFDKGSGLVILALWHLFWSITDVWPFISTIVHSLSSKELERLLIDPFYTSSKCDNTYTREQVFSTWANWKNQYALAQTHTVQTRQNSGYYSYYTLVLVAQTLAWLRHWHGSDTPRYIHNSFQIQKIFLNTTGPTTIGNEFLTLCPHYFQRHSYASYTVYTGICRKTFRGKQRFTHTRRTSGSFTV